MSNLIGRRIGAYVVKSRIGGGSHSDVYLAEDTAHGNRQVALKVLRLEYNAEPDKVKRFWDGGHAARALQHEHIVPFYDAGLADSHYYIAMEHMAGRSLEDLLQESGQPVPPTLAIQYLDQIAGAVDFAHQRGIIHRDIKPSNILLSKDRRNACLTDFGVAKLTGQATKTEYGTLIGTPEYMSPEQILGHPVDARSDIYSLGVTAYHMLTGKLPFDGMAVSVLYNHVNTPPPSVRSANKRLSAALNRPIAKALDKQPDRRYASAAAFVADLQQAIGMPSRAKAAPKPQPARPAPSRRMIWAIAALALVVVAAILLTTRGGEPITVIVTRNVTMTPVPGAVAAAMVTSTIAPTPRPTSTARAGAAATPGATATRATATPRKTEAPPRATEPETEKLRLLSPVDGANIPGDRGLGQVFSWEFDRAVAANESFELRFFPVEGGGYLAPFGWRKESRISDINLSALPPGSYNWVVAVVRGVDGNWEADVIVSRPFRLTWGQ